LLIGGSGPPWAKHDDGSVFQIRRGVRRQHLVLVKRLLSGLASNRRRALAWLPAALAVLVAAAIAADTVLMVVRTYSPLPFWDQWDSLMDYQVLRHGNFTLGHLFALHNEHRLAVPRLIFWADYALAGGTNKLNLTVIGLIQAGHAALLLSLIGAPRWREKATYVVAAAVVALLMSIGQWENFTWGFQSQFVGVFALATGAYLLLAKAVDADGRRRIGFFFGALALLFLATFSMANGLVAAAIAVVICLVLSAPWWMPLGCAAYVLAAGLFYFHNFHSPGEHSTLTDVMARPWDYATYVLSYMGNPLGEQLLWQPVGLPPELHLAATVLGGFGVVLGAASVLLVLLRRETARAQTVLVGLMLFVLASAALTASGRLNFGLWQAYSSRYRTPTSLFWAAQIIFWFRAVWPPVVWARRAAVAFSACALATLLWLQHAIKPDLYAKATVVHLAETALLGHVPDIYALNGAFPRGGEVFVRAEILREYDKSVFTEPRAAWAGHNLAQIGPMRPGECQGAFDVLTRSPFGALDGLRAAGWAWDLKARRAARDVVLADDGGRVIGFGRSGERRPDVRQLLRYPWSIDSGWVGIARVEPGGLHAFAVLHDGAVCEVGVKSAAALPPQLGIAAESSARVGPALATATFGGGPAWTLDGAPSATGRPPPEARAYSSWSGADKNTGFITFGPLNAAPAEIMIGLITGPDTTGQSILVKDADTSEVLGALQPIKTIAWTWVRLTLPDAARGRRVIIQGVDHGADWGQWMGVTDPHAVSPRAR
jgi:hypothetical protein